MYQLSEVKELQEREVAEEFVSRLLRIREFFEVHKIKNLKETDYDFLLDTSVGNISLQITEVVEREFAFQITKEEYDSEKFKFTMLKENGKIPWAIDMERLNNSICRAIEKKIGRHYAKTHGEILWLLVFTTSSCLHLIDWGKRDSEAKSIFETIQNIHDEIEKSPFDEIWFLKLLFNPILIWPPQKMVN